jgi:hypothetical protein
MDVCNSSVFIAALDRLAEHHQARRVQRAHRRAARTVAEGTNLVGGLAA